MKRLLIALAVGSALLGGCKPRDRQAENHGPVAVTVAVARTEDVPIYLDGLGTVQAYNTVTVRAQVDGQLIAVPFREGQQVKPGDLLAQVDPRPYRAQLEEAIAKQAQDEAALSNARADLRRYQDLAPQGYVSKQQLDNQQHTVKQDEAAVEADRAAVANARVQLGYTRITSPIAGVTGIRLVDVGNLVRASDQTGIVVVTQIQPIAVVFTLPEQVLPQLPLGDVRSLTVQALDRSAGRVLAAGKLLAVDNQIDTTTGTVKLKAEFANRQRKLWPGQFVNVRLLLRVQHGGLVIPESAVQRGPDGAYAYLIKAGNTAVMQPLQITQIEDGQALIAKGLAPGDRVVTDGSFQLRPGAKVRVARTERPALASAASTGSATGLGMTAAP